MSMKPEEIAALVAEANAIVEGGDLTTRGRESLAGPRAELCLERLATALAECAKASEDSALKALREEVSR